MTVAILGGTTLDIFVWGLSQLPQIDATGDEFTARSLTEVGRPPVFTIGGNAGNAAYVLSRLGCEVRLSTSIGDDLPGRLVKEWLRSAGCQWTILPPTDHTAVNIITIDKRQQRYSFFHPVRIESPAALAQLRHLSFEPGDHLLLTGYPHPDLPVLKAWAEHAHAHGASVALDIGPVLAGFSLKILGPLLPLLDLLYGNTQELRGLEPEDPEERIVEVLLRHLRRGLVVKRGSVGATFVDRQGRTDTPAFPVRLVTSVGAGDAFNAAFTYKYLLQKTNPAESLRFASALVAIMLGRGLGPLAAPDAQEVKAFLQSI